jgi:hypothetical protein
MDADRPPEVLDYASDAQTRGSNAASARVTRTACVLAAGLLFAFGAAGVASDRIRIPVPKKIALTVAAITVSALLLRVRAGRSYGCGLLIVLYLLYVAASLVSLWFWN